MRISKLAEVIAEGRVLGPDADVSDLTHDSREVRAGCGFFCVPGENFDGHVFAKSAVAAGAVAVICERELDVSAGHLIVPSVRAAMGPISAEFFGRPSEHMNVVGVTGTNGKTTITYMLEAIGRHVGQKTGVIGTVETRILESVLPGVRTTPEAVETQRLFASMLEEGVQLVAMEVSSHGLDLGRADGTRFAASVFTNLTQDHLDYHADMDDYFEAKALLFETERSAKCVVNIDDQYGVRLAERIEPDRLTTFSLRGRQTSVDGMLGEVTEVTPAGSLMRVRSTQGEVTVRVPLLGRYNLENALGALGAACAIGIGLQEAAEGIETLQGVPGRMESIQEGQEFLVLVDYAHTPDSLRGALLAAKELVSPGGMLWAVFGCGGDRDRTKRPLMGAVVDDIADKCIVTSDNPRSENPEQIVSEILAGMQQGPKVEAVVDRKEAIASALAQAEAGDVVVVAGKGHETGQSFADKTVPFDDRDVCREILRSK